MLYYTFTDDSDKLPCHIWVKQSVSYHIFLHYLLAEEFVRGEETGVRAAASSLSSSEELSDEVRDALAH